MNEQTSAAGNAEGAQALNRLFADMRKVKATDLHLKAGRPPMLRVQGDLRALAQPPLDAESVQRMVYGILTPERIRVYESLGNIDFAHVAPDETRYRVNVFRQRGATSLAARAVKTDIPGFAALNLPPMLSKIAEEEKGLVILAGITGSGKSTTLAAMIQQINERRPCHILCIEDPIEYLYADKKACINQREIGVDVESFHAALRNAVREDPDVILIGEMRDHETFETALQSSETGHLVFGTVHASTAASAIGRILALFPVERHHQIRQSLQFNLKAVVCQKLLPGAKAAAGLVPAVEVMMATPIVQKLIREGRDEKLPDAVRAGRKDGMQDFNQSLQDLVNRGLVTKATALVASPNPGALEMLFQGITSSEDERIIE
ncbi:MAG: PilT/PilU family type 4a pilus ATPase [Planctomycetota bacterium]